MSRHPRLRLETSLAIALACVVVFLIANLTPVVGIEIAGSHAEANVWQATRSMNGGWIAIAALTVLATMLVVPFTQLLLVIWLLSFACLGRRVPALVRVLIALHSLRPWSMSEVFLLGSLVAVVKLANFLPVSTGPGLWSLAVLTTLLAVLGRVDAGAWWSLDDREP